MPRCLPSPTLGLAIGSGGALIVISMLAPRLKGSSEVPGINGMTELMSPVELKLAKKPVALALMVTGISWPNIGTLKASCPLSRQYCAAASFGFRPITGGGIGGGRNLGRGLRSPHEAT